MPGFSIAPGTFTALANRGDARAYYLFYGDLSEMGQIEALLRGRGFPVVKSDVYPGFDRAHLGDYVRALRLLFDERAYGWWSQRGALIEHGICTAAEYAAALNGEGQ